MTYLKRNFNISIIFESISLFGCSSILMYLLLSEKIYTLIIPNTYFTISIWILSISIMVYSLFLLRNIKKKTLLNHYKGAIIYSICSILLSFPALNSNAMSYAKDDTIDQIIKVQKTTTSPTAQRTFNDGIDTVHKKITLTSQNYYDTILKITKHIDEYKGYTINATGFVSYHDQSLKNNDFVLARTLMICCAADMTPFGLTSEYKQEKPLRENTWYTMNGTISERNFHGMKQIYITNVNLKESAEIDGYIFPK